QAVSKMKVRLLSLFLAFANAQLPFNIMSIPASVRDPFLYTMKKVAEGESQCFREIKTTFNSFLLAGITAQKCKTLDCLKDDKITNASFAVKMLASTGHPHSFDIDEFSVTWAGDPMLCRNIQGPFETKYCFMHVNIDWKQIDFDAIGFSLSALPGGHLPEFDKENRFGRCSPFQVTNAKVAFCIPASCEKDQDIGKIIHNVTKGIAHLCEINCAGPKEEPSSWFYFFNTVFIALLSIAIAASIFEYFVISSGMESEWNPRTGWKVLTAFSVPRNTLAIFSLNKSADSILCLDAIRFTTLVWVVNGHSDMATADGDNGLQLLRETNNFFAYFLGNGYPSVDTFFLISGLLVSYTFFKKAHNNPAVVYAPINWVMYYVHRWLRLTPSYMLFVAMSTAWIPQMHDIYPLGLAQNSTRMVENCKNSWWLNALYVNNFQKLHEICFPISWFLSVDTQLYWIAPIFLIAIYYSRKTGMFAILGAALCSIGCIVFLTWYYDLPAMGFTVRTTNVADFSNYLYFKPWTRCIPYLTGIVCGYFIVQAHNCAIKTNIPKTREIIGYWFISTSFALIVIFAVYNYARGHSEWGVAERALYLSFARIGWSVAVAWVVLACVFDWAGPVKPLLEHPLWYPLGRLSYGAFLGHLFILHFIFNLGDRPPHFVSLVHTYLTVTVPIVFLSYAIAYVWSCLVEIPFAKLEVIIVGLLMNPKRGHRSDNKIQATKSECSYNGKCKNDWGITTIEVNHS
ncbi:hypothetical protein PMAYCL1PPCAC_15195, partial [Pristionchus mayeri]